jgi:transposase
MLCPDSAPHYCAGAALVRGRYTGKAKSQSFPSESLFNIFAKFISKCKYRTKQRRWVAERTFGRLEKFRHLEKNCERKIYNTLQMTGFCVYIAVVKRY